VSLTTSKIITHLLIRIITCCCNDSDDDECVCNKDVFVSVSLYWFCDKFCPCRLWYWYLDQCCFMDLASGRTLCFYFVVQNKKRTKSKIKSNLFIKQSTEQNRHRASTKHLLTFHICAMLSQQRNLCTSCKSARLCTTRGHRPLPFPKLHLGPCSSVGMQPQTDTQTYRHVWPIYMLCSLRLAQNVKMYRRWYWTRDSEQKAIMVFLRVHTVHTTAVQIILKA